MPERRGASGAAAGPPDPVDKTNTANPVWADSAYRSKADEACMARNRFASKVHFRRARGADLTRPQAKANAARSEARSAIETVFVAGKHRFGLFIGVARAAPEIGLANIAYDAARTLWLRRRTVSA